MDNPQKWEAVLMNDFNRLFGQFLINDSRETTLSGKSIDNL